MLPVAEIQAMIQPIVDQRGAFIVDIGIHGNKGNTIIEIFLDTSSGITTAGCAEISKEVSKEFDRRDIIHGQYHLVVSSPGVDRPLRVVHQYPRNIGRKMRVNVRTGDAVDILEGTLLDATDDHIVLELDEKGEREIKFSDIESSRVCLPW
jgi:ribosome maturation factor RimP